MRFHLNVETIGFLCTGAGGDLGRFCFGRSLTKNIYNYCKEVMMMNPQHNLPQDLQS